MRDPGDKIRTCGQLLDRLPVAIYAVQIVVEGRAIYISPAVEQLLGLFFIVADNMLQ